MLHALALANIFVAGGNAIAGVFRLNDGDGWGWVNVALFVVCAAMGLAFA